MSQLLPTSTTEQEFIGLVKMGLLERQVPPGVWSRLRYHHTCMSCRHYDGGRYVEPRCRSCLVGDTADWQFDSTVASKYIRLLGGDTSASQQEEET